MILRRCLAACIAAATTGVAFDALAQGPDEPPVTANAHLERGLRFFNTQDYAQAIAEFKAGYQLEPNPDFLYALAQAERLAGDCKDATQAYLAFLRTSPPEKQAELARGNLAKCEQELAREPAKAVPPPPPPATTAPTPDKAAPPRAAKAPFYTDVLGDVLAGVGLAGLGAGVALWIGAAGHASSANDASTYASYVSEADSASKLRNAALVAGAAGAAFLGAGIVRWATRPSPTPAVSLSVSPIAVRFVASF